MLKVQRIPVGAYDVTIEMVKPSPQQLCKSSILIQNVHISLIHTKSLISNKLVFKIFRS